MMTKKAGAADLPFAGATDFGAEPSYIAPPPREVREAARVSSEAIGFVSDKGRGEAARPAEKPRRPKQEARFPDQYNIRLRTEDRLRLDDYAYRHRIAKGEALRRLLDIAEAEEDRQAGRGRASESGGDE